MRSLTTPRRPPWCDALARCAAILALVLGGLALSCEVRSPFEPEDRVTADPQLPALSQPEPPVMADSGRLLLSATATIVGDTARAWLYVGAKAFNGGSRAWPLSQLCIVQVRAFAGGAPTGAKPVWATPASPTETCPNTAGLDTLPPGAKYWLRGADAVSSVASILSAGASAGRYRFDALVRVGQDTVAAPAGTLQLSSDSRPALRDPRLLRYAVETRVEGIAPRLLVTRVALTNPLDRPFYLEYGACSLRLHAYRTPARTGQPVWRSEYRQPPGNIGTYACPLYLATKLLQPGESFAPGEFGAAIPMDEILADSLPDGRYYFVANVEFQQGGGLDLSHPGVWFSAGEADLTSGADPLPAERTIDGVTYRARVAEDPTVAGGVRLTVSVSNGGEAPVFLRQYPSDCAVQLVGYTTAARRDAAYRGGQPDLRLQVCPLVFPAAWLTPGETRTLTGSAPVPGMEPARYFFAAWLSLWQEPAGALRSPSLSAGDAAVGGR